MKTARKSHINLFKEIINFFRGIKFEHFVKKVFEVVLKIIKPGKGVGLDEVSPEVCKTKKFDDILLYI